MSHFMSNAQKDLKRSQPAGHKPSGISKGFAATRGLVYFDLARATSSNGTVNIPVSFTSTDSIVSLDFALKFNDALLTYESIISSVPYLTDVLAKYSPDDKTLRFTSNSKHYYLADQVIAILRFKKNGVVKESDLFSLVGYLNGDKVSAEIRGHFHSASLKFWSNDHPIQYNADDPDHHLITNIYGADSTCSIQSGPLQPGMNGEFIYSPSNGPFIKIERDILPSTNVQAVINGFDASLANKIILNDTSFVPNIFQLIALDVNTDGVISAGDISQINQRSVKTIPEFRQKWNYGKDGIPNGQASKDWLFIDTLLLASPAYHISSIYPANDGTGYSKFKVPVVPFCLHSPLSSDGAIYTGILLGDINGNYSSITNDGKIK